MIRRGKASERCEDWPSTPSSRGVAPPVLGEVVLVRSRHGVVDRYRVVRVGVESPHHRPANLPCVVEPEAFPGVSRETLDYGTGPEQWHRAGDPKERGTGIDADAAMRRRMGRED